MFHWENFGVKLNFQRWGSNPITNRVCAKIRKIEVVQLPWTSLSERASMTGMKKNANPILAIYSFLLNSIIARSRACIVYVDIIDHR